MSIINRALQEMSFRINRRVLELTFTNPMDRYRQRPVSLENQILELVLKPRVLYDMNVVGGTEVQISLEGIPRDDFDNFQSVYRIPKAKSNGRSIIAVLSISYLSPSLSMQHSQSSQCGRGGLLKGAEAILNSQADIPFTSSHYATLIGENVVLVRGATLLPQNAYLRCVLAYDEHLSGFSIRSTSAFVKLVELAVKSYIYNTMVVQLDQGYLEGGVALDSVRNIVDSYSDAEELYQEHLKLIMSKVTFMQDQESMSRYTRLMVGGYQ